MCGEGFGRGDAGSQRVEIKSPQQGIVAAHPYFAGVLRRGALETDLFVSFDGFESGVPTHADNGSDRTVHFGSRQGFKKRRATDACQHGHDSQDRKGLKNRVPFVHGVFSISVFLHQTVVDTERLSMPNCAWDGSGIAVICTRTPRMLCVCACGSMIISPSASR